MAWKEKVAKRFDSSAQKYDLHSDVQEHVATQLTNALPDLVQPKILEIGCGTGALTQKLIEKYPGGTFEITDISPHMLEQAKARLMNCPAEINWAVMDGENPSCTGKFDLIVGNMTFQWFENPKGSLENLRLYLKPGGHIFYAVPGSQSFKEWQSVLADLGLPSGILNFSDWPCVFREEEHMTHYESALEFLRRVKAIGAGTPRQGYNALGYTDIMCACRRFDREFNGQISWHILYGSLA